MVVSAPSGEAVKSAFVPRLVNGPFGDPGLFIASRWRGTAMQFDLGRIDRFPAAELLKVTHAFVSHAHMDHFYGFDRLLRLFLARDAHLSIYGPPGMRANVAGKLAGYTWNLTDGYSFVIDVHDVAPQGITSTRLAAAESFRPCELGTAPFNGVLYQADGVEIHTTHLDHRIPCLAFALVEQSHLNVDTTALADLGIPPGRWLNDLKDAIRREAGSDETLLARWREKDGTIVERQLQVGDVRDRLIRETKGMRIAYVVDTLFSRDNVDRICELARGADVLYCEAPFLDEDRDEAIKRYHLTARQAGTIARLAGVRRLQVFHFSPRYDGRAAAIYSEAEATFRGESPPDVPV